MSGAIFTLDEALESCLPQGLRRLKHSDELYQQNWSVLALTPSGCGVLGEGDGIHCDILLVPGDCNLQLAQHICAQSVITYGFSHRDSVTSSSLEENSCVLCVQRNLLRTDGEVIEPQEFPIAQLPEAGDAVLAILGLQLLQMPLT